MSLKLLTPVTVGDVQLKNRIALSPLTRGRSTNEFIPTEIMIDYYVQRSTCGLIISEATGVSRQGMGWYYGPGIWSETQVAEWKRVTDAVHAAGGVICMQLWHMGRAVHSDVTGQQPVAPSAIALEGEITAVNNKRKPAQMPKELTIPEIQQIIADYKRGAENAKRAGFDMVELHNANGYLPDLFLQSCTNKRTDAYGGSLENRLRLMGQLLDALCEVYPKERVGIRLSPNGAFQGMGGKDSIETFTAAIRLVGNRGIAFLDLMDGLSFGFHNKTKPFTLAMARDILATTAGRNGVTTLMGNAGYTRDTAEQRVQAGEADMIAFGRPYIGNPDLPERFAANHPLNPLADRKDWWGKGPTSSGYTSFPTMKQQARL